MSTKFEDFKGAIKPSQIIDKNNLSVHDLKELTKMKMKIDEKNTQRKAQWKKEEDDFFKSKFQEIEVDVEFDA